MSPAEPADLPPLPRQQRERPLKSPMWLTHHWPSEYDRCTVVGRYRVCRRCLVLYPLSAVVAVAVALGLVWPASLDAWFLWLLPLPAVVEFCLEHVHLARYSPRRQMAFTVLLAMACGRLYVLYLDDPRDSLVWSVAGTYLAVCLAFVLLRAFLPPPSSGPSVDSEA